MDQVGVSNHGRHPGATKSVVFSTMVEERIPMRRWPVLVPILTVLLLALAGCPPAAPAAPPATPAVETPVVEIDTPTPEDEEVTPEETPDETPTPDEDVDETPTPEEEPDETPTPEEEVETPEVDVTPEITPTDEITPTVTVMVETSAEHGEYLTDEEGFALYLFTQDTPNTSTCTGACAQRWPPLIAADEAMAGAGVDETLLGTTTREDGTLQVTYNGWPLYYFADDEAPGDTVGHEVGDVWFLVTPEGEQIGGQ
jgi:predicted lipoprotein with Yx(FWY)xxD motif